MLPEPVASPVVEPSRFEQREQSRLEAMVGMQIVVVDHVVDAHENTQPEAHDGLERPRGVVGGGVPVAPDHHRTIASQPVEHVAHLVSAVRLTRLRIKVDRYGDKGLARKRHIGHDRRLLAEALLPAGHLVLAVLERDAPHIPDRIAAQDRVAVQPKQVLSFDVVLDAGSLRKIHIARSEGIVHAEFPGQAARDMPVAGPRHPYIRLGQQQDVTGCEVAVVLERLELPFILNTPFEVPGGDPVSIAGRRFALREALGFRRGQHAADGGRDAPIGRMRQQFGSIPAGGQDGKVRDELLAQDPIGVPHSRPD